MELPIDEGEMPLPINSIHHDLAPQLATYVPNGHISSTIDDNGHASKFKKIVKYRECLKNHAASMGGNATDGCGEFMPSGEEGSLEALTCSACNCHRNFHRKEVEGEGFNRFGRKLILGHHQNLVIPSRGGAPPPRQMIMSYNMGCFPSESDEQEGGGGGSGGGGGRGVQMVRKRFRTKFTPEQKEKMLQFAEKVGWRMQKQEESLVQEFCQEVGVKRRVFKVWMHNNKHNLAKKDNNDVDAQNHVSRDFDSRPVSISDPR